MTPGPLDSLSPDLARILSFLMTASLTVPVIRLSYGSTGSGKAMMVLFAVIAMHFLPLLPEVF